MAGKRGKTRSARRPAPGEENQRLKPEIYEGLQIPTKQQQVTGSVKTLVLKPLMTPDEVKGREGTYFEEKEIDQILEESADVYGLDPTTGAKKLLARFRKAVIPSADIRIGWEAYYQTAAPSRNRGAAAGPIQLKSNYWKNRNPVDVKKWSARYMQDGKKSKMSVNNNVFSSVLGYFEQTPFMGLPCRLTSYTQRYFDRYRHGLPYIKQIDALFRRLVPGPHAKQLAAAKAAPQYRVDGTAFSSITINRNFRTALHMDDGDFREGFGNLSVIERGKYSGGATVFPRYGVGFNIRTGDFLAMDVHEWHCNTEMTETAEQKAFNKGLPKIHHDSEKTGTLGGEKGFTRISFVCYLREKLRGCKAAETDAYYKRIGFDPVHGPSKGTRRAKRDTTL